MLALARVGEDDFVYDLGCGDGRIVITAARRFGARGVGIDIDPARIAESRANARAAGISNRVRFYQQDLFETDLREASVVTLYLLTELNVRLRPKLLAELQPGTRIVSHAFDMGEWPADSMMWVKSADYGQSKVFYWVLPARVAGEWDVAVEARASQRRLTVRFDQTFQRIRGTATGAGGALPLARARLVGDSITYTVTGSRDDRPLTMRFSGEIAGDTMTGSVSTDGTSEVLAWSAKRRQS